MAGKRGVPCTHCSAAPGSGGCILCHEPICPACTIGRACASDLAIRFREIEGEHVAFMDGHPAGYIYREECDGPECWGYRHYGDFHSEMDHLGDLDHAKATVLRALTVLA